MFKLLSGTALVTLMAATPSLADLTPDDAWAIWQAQTQALGMTLTSEQHYDGDTLVIDTMRVAMVLPEDIAKGVISLGGVRFEPNGDGSITIRFPDQDTYVFAGKGEDGVFQVSLTADSMNVTGVMTGQPGNVNTGWSGDGMTLSLAEFTVDGEAAPDASMRFDIGPFSSRVATKITDQHVITGVSSAYSSSEYTFSFSDMDDLGNTSDMSGDMGQQIMEMAMTLPRDGIDVFNLPAQLRDGLSLSMQARMDDVATHQSTVIDGDVFLEIDTGIEYEYIDIRLNRDGFGYDLEAQGISLNYTIPMLEVPLDVTMPTVNAGLQVPLLQADTPQDFTFSLNMADVSVNDEVWAMGDPDGNFPRDPVTVAWDLSGTVTMLTDLVKFPEIINRNDLPAEILSARLDSLMINAVGASLSGVADFIFDNSDLETFDGMPAPEGTAELKLQGANMLIETLVAMELIGEDEVFGVRLVMGMMGRPGEGDDVLLSTIEIKDGEISANGQRLR